MLRLLESGCGCYSVVVLPADRSELVLEVGICTRHVRQAAEEIEVAETKAREKGAESPQYCLTFASSHAARDHALGEIDAAHLRADPSILEIVRLHLPIPGSG